MDKKQIIDKTVVHVKEVLGGESSGHDWWHVYRVWKMAAEIAEKEGDVDTFVVELAALLHDIADHKFHDGDLTVGPKRATEWLSSLGVSSEVSDHVAQIISQISFKGAKVETPMSTKEGSIVQDADRLDAIGAVGIARAFAYGGCKGHEMYNPAVCPTEHASFEEYAGNKSPAFNHFYEKLLLLKDRMNTGTGKKIAEGRHLYMKTYLDKFLKEWDGLE